MTNQEDLRELYEHQRKHNEAIKKRLELVLQHTQRLCGNTTAGDSNKQVEHELVMLVKEAIMML